MLLIMVLFTNQSTMLFSFANSFDVKITFYTTQSFYSKNTQTIQNGNVYMVHCNKENAKQTYLLLDKQKISGQSFSFVGQPAELKNLVARLNINVVSEENLGDIVVINGYCKKFATGVFVGSDMVNIQLAYNKGIITVGCPVILGSF